jgi:hypothetical protein
MNREILFRGQTESGKWVYGSLVQSNNGKCYIIHQTDNPIDADHDHWYIQAPAYKVKPETVKQFTGAEDVNKVKVFDGDTIVNINTGELQTVFWYEIKNSWYCGYIDQSNTYRDRTFIVSLWKSLGNLNTVKLNQ